MTISSVLKTLSVVTVATTAVVSTIAPAQAISLQGSVSLNGNATIEGGINPDPTTWGFNTAVFGDRTGDFAQVSTPPVPTIQDLTLDLDNPVDDTLGFYSAGPVTSFINFGTQTIDGVTAQLTFDLISAEFQRSRLAAGGFETVFLLPAANSPAQGVFNFNGQTIANGVITGTLSGSSDTYQLNLVAEPVPEPFTILGSLSALGVGAVLKKQQKKS
ncbi:MAG: PEP-CTERM sorting domain-containing protein [Cyanobacteria bacterium J06592_8]